MSGTAPLVRCSGCTRLILPEEPVIREQQRTFHLGCHEALTSINTPYEQCRACDRLIFFVDGSRPSGPQYCSLVCESHGSGTVGHR